MGKPHPSELGVSRQPVITLASEINVLDIAQRTNGQMWVSSEEVAEGPKRIERVDFHQKGTSLDLKDKPKIVFPRSRGRRFSPRAPHQMSLDVHASLTNETDPSTVTFVHSLKTAWPEIEAEKLFKVTLRRGKRKPEVAVVDFKSMAVSAVDYTTAQAISSKKAESTI